MNSGRIFSLDHAAWFGAPTFAFLALLLVLVSSPATAKYELDVDTPTIAKTPVAVQDFVVKARHSPQESCRHNQARPLPEWFVPTGRDPAIRFIAEP